MDKIAKKLTGRFQRQNKPIRSTMLLYIAWRNFASKKLRSFLTVFGVVVGVAAIYFLFSFGLGIQQLVTNQVIGDKSLKAIDVVSPNSKIIQLNEKKHRHKKDYQPNPKFIFKIHLTFQKCTLFNQSE